MAARYVIVTMVTHLTLAAYSYVLLALHIAGEHGTWEVVEL